VGVKSGQINSSTSPRVKGDVQKLAEWGATEVFFSLRSNLPSVEAAFQGMLEQMCLLSGLKDG
jgi:hypothetical protein